ncbi:MULTISPECIES: 50S ribosomal protein L24 [Dehalogenimonas]|uniref:Large ribosomal subunit protein uL24 n=2 Tax=Dehalogenimonas TaxID=670486 RepID=A0A0W0GFZ3_9CHLR|nr:50S ribosomal protein L24 [Dehalogenimonas alkenigignens]KTB47474.1 LSU ribosomal protein L24P [Dehalogenimonas alkenigignens]PVV83467.1 50S ribosomal protein L24 [Dehalogenimonas alkenigignens]
MKIKKDDNVLVISGKDRGKSGKVRMVYTASARVLVDGVNMTKKHSKARGAVRQAGIIERESPVHASNVMLLCAKCGKPARLGSKALADGKRVRVCKSCGEVID